MNAKKITQLTIILCLLTLPLSAQPPTSNCGSATAQTTLEINNVRATLLNGGDLFWNKETGRAGYEVPKNSGLTSIFSAGLWVAGKDELGKLRVAARTYRTRVDLGGGKNADDFWPGPIVSDSIQQIAICGAFDRFWEVAKSDIDQFLLAIQSNAGTLPLSQIPASIKDWAGRNNPYFTDFALPPNMDLAPFVDTDGDQIYDPTKGDYPDIKGDYAIWWIFNDVGNEHTESVGGVPLGIEISTLAYAYATNDALNNTTFYQYQLRYKGNDRLNNVYIGHQVDVDLGQFDDDLVGCSPEHHLGYAYNGDEEDGQYGDRPPMAGIKIVKGLKEHEKKLGMYTFMYYNGDFTVQGDPDIPNDYYTLLRGLWQDEVPLTFGGSGRGGTEITRYMFPDNPQDPSGWSECSEGHEPADRRFVISSGPIDLKPGEVQNITYAIIWVRPPVGTYPCPDIKVLTDVAEEVQTFFDTTHIVTSVSTMTHQQNFNPVIRVYPNPLETTALMEFSGSLNQAKTVHIYNFSGQLIKTYANVSGSTLLLENENWHSGIYYYQVFQDQQVIGSGKLMVD